MPDYLLQAVIASSLRFSTDPYFEDNLFFTNKRKVTADIFANNSWRILSSRFVDGDDDCNVGVVQAITLLAIYEFVGAYITQSRTPESTFAMSINPNLQREGSAKPGSRSA